MDEGFYPMELVLMEELHIQPSEIKKLNEETKWMYFYYVQAKKRKENENIAKQMQDAKSGRHSAEFHFPDNFVSIMDNTDKTKELIELEEKEKEK